MGWGERKHGCERRRKDEANRLSHDKNLLELCDWESKTRRNQGN
jgi:hypothetical protein